MDEKHLRSVPGIDADDWEQTPASVRKIVVQLARKVEQLEQLGLWTKKTDLRNIYAN